MVKLAVPGVEQAVCATGCELMDGVVFTVSATLVEVAAALGEQYRLRCKEPPVAAVSVDKESELVSRPETVRSITLDTIDKIHHSGATGK